MKKNVRLAFASTVILVFSFGLIQTGCNQATTTKTPPVSCTVRESIVDRGLVLIVKNTSDEDVSVWVHTTSNNNLLGKKETFSLSPGAEKQLGWLEGFHFGSNSTFAIGGEGYSSKLIEIEDLPVRSD